MSAFFSRIAAVITLAAAVAIPIHGQGRGAFALGVLRRDGILVPFTSYNGRGWNADWPGPGAAVDLPIALADVPKRWWGAPGAGARWTAWLLDGTSRPLELKKPEQTPVFCGAQLGLRTDYPAGDFDPREPTVPKDGIAIAGNATLEPIARVSNFVGDAARIVQAITDDFNREERLAVERFRSWSHPYDDVQRKSFPIELEAFYRTRDSTPSGTWTTSYVEAVRRFPARALDHGCGLITFVRGWVLEREGHKPIVDVGARITFCDRADVSFMLPFGKLLIDREPYWVYQVSSWRDEIYGVSRVKPDEVRPVMAVSGGGCPKDAPGGRGRNGG